MKFDKLDINDRKSLINTLEMSDPDENRNIINEGYSEKIRKYAGKVPFAEEAVASYHFLMDSETPTKSKAIIAGALAYFVVPTDIIPDFIAIMGFTDDATVMFIAVNAIDLKERHLQQAREFLLRQSPDDPTE